MLRSGAGIDYGELLGLKRNQNVEGSDQGVKRNQRSVQGAIGE